MANWGTKLEEYPFREELAERLVTTDNVKKVKRWLERTYGEVVALRTLQTWSKRLRKGELIFQGEPPIYRKDSKDRYLNKMQKQCWEKEQEVKRLKKEKPGSPEAIRAEKFLFKMYEKLYNLAVEEKKAREKKKRYEKKREKAESGKPEKKAEQLSPEEREALERKFAEEDNGNG